MFPPSEKGWLFNLNFIGVSSLGDLSSLRAGYERRTEKIAVVTTRRIQTFFALDLREDLGPFYRCARGLQAANTGQRTSQLSLQKHLSGNRVMNEAARRRTLRVRRTE